MTLLADVQGTVLRAYDLPFARYVFLHIADAVQGREWLGRVLKAVTTVTKWDEKPASTFNVAFSFSGLEALGLSAETLATFPEPFREGMAKRAGDLSDTGPSDPDHWKVGADTQELHAVVAIHARDEPELDRVYAWHEKMLQGAASAISVREAASLDTDKGTEHFGYRDGFGQPHVEGSGLSPSPGQGAPEKDGSWRPLALGEFVLGYEDETGGHEPMPHPDVLGRNGSYMVLRILHQNVAAYRDFVARGAKELGRDREWFAARMVGRWRSGAPVALTPDHDDPQLGDDPERRNDFRYKDDPKGFLCPRSAHIRRVNPRDAMDGNSSVTVNRHRILRRGLPYGPSLLEGRPDDGEHRGFVFIAINASISRQFEFIQKMWINNGDFIDHGQEKDPVLGNHGRDEVFTIPAKPIRKRVQGLSSFVETRGGGYFFLPGIKGLQYLSGTHERIVPNDQDLNETPKESAAASSCPFLPRFDALEKEVKNGSPLADAAVIRKRAELIKHALIHDPARLFTELRANRPVLVTGGPVPTIVTKNAHVIEVLSKNGVFPVKPYQNPININPPPAGLGHFLLADLDLARHDREKEAFRSAMPKGEECRAGIFKEAEDLVNAAKARGDRTIDVIKDVAERLPIRVIKAYFGVPTGGKGEMPEGYLFLVIGRIFRGLFMNLENDPIVQWDAEVASGTLRSYVEKLVQARKAQVLGSPQMPGDMLGKFIWYQGRTESPYRDVFSSDERVVANLCGILTGGPAGFVQSIGYIIDVLSTRDASLWKDAVGAANSKDVGMLWKYAREALRFRPQGPGIVRGTFDATTLGGVPIPAGNILLASHQSAMMDESRVPDPSRFDITRPDSSYLHFGVARNQCLAIDFAPVVITEALRAILLLKGLQRPEQSKLKMGNPYPESLVLSYDS